MTIIDSHQHFWHFEPERDRWITEEMAVLRRDFLPADLENALYRNGVAGTVLVQADQSEGETEFLLGLADDHPFIMGVVGWVDLRSPRLTDRLDHYSQARKLCGFRHVVQGEGDPNFLLRADFQRGIAALGPYHFTYDILVYPHQLGAVLEFVRRFPDQPFVIDHLAKPYIRDGFFDGWAVLMREIARSENVLCKLSGMVTEADWQKWRFEDFARYLEVIFEAFGLRRIMYGSDWPVCLLAAEYGEVLEIAKRSVLGLSPDEQEAVLGGNARAFYGLELPPDIETKRKAT